MSGTLVETIESVARGWAAWMLGVSWQVTLTAAVLGLLTWALRRRSAVFLHAVWLLVLVRLVVPPTFTFPTGWGWWVMPAAEVAEAEPPVEKPVQPSVVGKLVPAAAEAMPEQAAAPTADSPLFPNATPGGYVARITPRQTSLEPSTAPPPSTSPASAKPVAAADDVPVQRVADQPEVPPSRWPVSLSLLLMLSWGGVVATLLGLLVLGQWRVGQWIREAEPIEDPVVFGLLDDCRERLGIRREIEIRNSQSCTTPLVVGLFRPVVLLPAAVVERFSVAELEAVLVHELNHIARHDALVNLLQGVLGAVYFFHPLVWWANGRIRQLREDACDELTVQALDGRRKAYGEAILKTSEILGYAAPPLAMGIMESKHPAKRRLLRILDPRLPSASQFGWGTLTAIVVLAAVLLPAAGKPSSDAGELIPVAGSKGPMQDQSPRRDEPPLLRYGWKAGDHYSYSLKIEAEQGDYIETYTGSPSYRVNAADALSATLAVQGNVTSFRRPVPGRRIGPFDMRPPFRNFGPGFPGENIVVVDRRGQVLSARRQSSLPYLLGNVTKLLIEPLPQSPQREWSSTGELTVELEEDSYPYSAFRTASTQLTADEWLECGVDQIEDETLVIHKRYLLRSRQTNGPRPALELSGTATIVFDRKAGVPRSIRFSGGLTRSRGNVTERTPIEITCDRQAPAVEDAQKEDVEIVEPSTTTASGEAE